ncbi:MAG: ferritin-like domain-containing protein [Byssovorax sp.]
MNRRSTLLALRVSLLSALGLGACGVDEALSPLGAGGAGGAGGSSTTTGTSTAATTGGAGGGTGETTGSGGATTSSTGSDGSTTGNGGSGGGTAGAGGSGGGAGGSPAGPCVDPMPALDPLGNDTGFVRCADGTVHRAAITGCDPTAGAPLCDGNEQAIHCATDADCAEHPHGRCAHIPGFAEGGGPHTICGCTYPCLEDADCNVGEACVCAGVVLSALHPWSACAPATCTTDADCPSGECGAVFFDTGCGFGAPVLACRSAADGCRTKAQCLPDVPLCVVDPSAGNTWQCVAGPPCGIGRPLLVEGRARTAKAEARTDWSVSDAGVFFDGASDRERAALARHWKEIAALEHASVASFARFTLHLLALGAPASLVAEAQRAGLDEIEHARLAFALAGACAGAPLGPAPLDLSGFSLSADRREVLGALIAEACVGETVAVAEAQALAGRVADPALARLHARIAADEQRHAELGWRALAWMLAGADGATLAFAAACFEEAMASASQRPDPPPLVAPALGLLSATEIAAIRREALREVVAPCARALLGSTAAITA